MPARHAANRNLWFYRTIGAAIAAECPRLRFYRPKEAGNSLPSCTMVITQPNKFVAEVYDRMTVILEAKDFEQWESGDTQDAAALMKPEDVLQCAG